MASEINRGQRISAFPDLSWLSVAFFSLPLLSVAAFAAPKHAPPLPPGTVAAPTKLSSAAIVAASTAAPSTDKVYEDVRMLLEILSDIRQDYVEKTDPRTLLYGAAEGMVRRLDPFSQFLEPQANQDLKTETKGEFGGLGVRVSAEGEWLDVITAIPDTPAFDAGLLPEDRILAIDGASTKGMSNWDAVGKLRGKPGSEVTLLVSRRADGGGESRFTVTLKRQEIKIRTVDTSVSDDHIAYLRVVEFNAKTPEDVLRSLERDRKKGATSLILDLRNNPGGLLDAAVKVAGFFLPAGKLITYTEGRNPLSRVEYRSEGAPTSPDWPMAVLVNENSASGAEIVAGALQDDGRAVVIGERTYGKASVQSVIPLANSCALRLTVAHYYTPQGRLIQRDEKKHTGGISPDITVPVPDSEKDKLFRQWELIYAKGKSPRSAVKKRDQVPDDALDMADSVLRARRALMRLGTGRG